MVMELKTCSPAAPGKRLENLLPGDHLCCIYRSEAEHRKILTPFVRQGLEQNHKVIYIADVRSAEDIFQYLREDGLDPTPYRESSQLVLLSSSEAYTRGGVFDPDAMIDLFKNEMQRALADGFSALRITGEMTWALKGTAGSERLIEYEARLNRFIPGSKCIAVCQYDRRRFDAKTLLDVLLTHPIAVIGTEAYENFYYLPPQDFFGPNPDRKTLDQWIQNLDEHRNRLALQEKAVAE